MLLMLLSVAPALAVADAPRASLSTVQDGVTVDLPLVETRIKATVHGDVADVQLVQVFANPSERPLDAQYVFPLPTDAAVHRMRMTAGDQVIEAEIREAQAAQAEFDAAQAEGQQAALLTQHRPNLFSQDLANLPPGEVVQVEISYAHVVDRQDGAYVWHLPLVVGPRFVPEGMDSEWALPAGATLPESIDAERLDVQLIVDAGLPLQSLGSSSHSVQTVEHSGSHARGVQLAPGATIGNQDLVVTWTLAGESPAVGATSWAQDGSGVVSVLIEPPIPSEALPIAPREVVFVLDTSCSMSGEPMDASKRFMHQALEGLRPQDTFRVLRFSDSASGLADAPLPATSANVQRGQAYVDQLEGQGGTMMTQGVRAALGPETDPDRMRIVVFLTDGYIGNDVEVIGLVEQELGDARLFSLGVGGNVNRYLLEEMARSGRGTARIVEDPAHAQASAEALAAQLESPFLTDVQIDWGDAVVEQVTPRVLPDLFLGDSLRVMALVQAPGTLDVTVRGTVGGEQVALPARVVVPAQSQSGEGLPVVWARSVIGDLMLDYISPRTDAVGRERVQHQVTALGLEHRLVTRWTSFVAVAPSREMVRGPMESDRSIAGAGSGGRSWGGSAAPEPHVWAALALLSLMGGLGLRRRTG